MTAGVFDDTIDQGATWSTLFTLKNSDDTPVDLTGYTARMQARLNYNSATALLSLTSPSGGISFPDATEGKIQVVVSATQTAALPAGVTMVYDLEVESGGGIVTRVVQGTLYVSPEVTK